MTVLHRCRGIAEHIGQSSDIHAVKIRLEELGKQSMLEILSNQMKYWLKEVGRSEASVDLLTDGPHVCKSNTKSVHFNRLGWIMACRSGKHGWKRRSWRGEGSTIRITGE